MWFRLVFQLSRWFRFDGSGGFGGSVPVFRVLVHALCLCLCLCLRLPRFDGEISALMLALVLASLVKTRLKLCPCVT